MARTVRYPTVELALNRKRAATSGGERRASSGALRPEHGRAPTDGIQLIDNGTDEAGKRCEEMVKEAGCWLDGLERRLEDREWIAVPEFFGADILLATVLREVRTRDLLSPYPRLASYYMCAHKWRRCKQKTEKRQRNFILRLQLPRDAAKIH